MKVKIGDFLHRIKRPVTLEPEKLYKLVTIKLYHNGVILREQKKGKDIGSAMHEVKAGDFILSGIDARNGAFGIVPDELDGAIVTNDFWYFQLDESVISKELFLNLTKTTWFDEICRKGSDGTTQRIRLQKDKFFEQVIELPEIKTQKGLLKRLDSVQVLGSDLSTEITHQQDLLKKLRQQILQDAISGKLTAEWRKMNPHVEPASELLKRIQAEKVKLGIKQKPLPPIRKEEIPFELPEGWVWCRLGELISCTDYGTSEQANEFGDVGVLAMGNIQDGNVILSAPKKLKSSSKDLPKLLLKHNDVLFNRTNSWELVGKTGIYKGSENEYSFASYLIRLRFITCIPDLYNKVLNSRYYRESQIEPQIIKQCGQANFNGTKLQNTLVPLMPHKEMTEIWSQLNSISNIDEIISEQIEITMNKCSCLLQSILKEAFEA